MRSKRGKLMTAVVSLTLVLSVMGSMALSISAQDAGTESAGQTLTASVYQDGTYQTPAQDAAVITLTGEMPDGASVKAYPVETAIEDANVLTAYDITIFNSDGSKFEPENSPIEVKIDDSAVRSAIEASQNIAVYHIADQNAAPQQVSAVKTDDTSVTFAADSFSVYVVTTPENHYTHTYQFFDENGAEITAAKQILSTGETLSEPKTPSKEGFAFLGWYTAQTGGSEFTQWNVEGSLTASQTTMLYARYAKAYYVFYMSGSGTDSKVVFTQTYASSGAEINTDDVPFSTGSVDQALIGWSTQKGATQPESNLKLNGGDVTLYPVIASAHWITYHTNGGSTVAPAYVLNNGVTKAPTPPERVGYTFSGWYSNSALTGSQFTFGTTLSGSIDLYAKWTANRVSYTVVYWQENADDGKDSYVEKTTLRGLTGTDATYTSKSYSGFQLNTAKTNAAATKIAGDGTTIRNVYYQRKEITMTFKVGRNTVKTITQKYDSDISTIWDDSVIAGYMDDGYVWQSSLTGDKYTFLQKMPAQDITMTGVQWSGKKHRIYYYLETLNGKAPNNETIKKVGSKTYYLYHTTVFYGSSNVYVTYDEDYFPITGFSQKYTSSQTQYWEDFEYNYSNRCYEALLYYERQSYSISFQSNGGTSVANISNILYQADISNKAPAGYTVDSTTKTVDGKTYYFKGWYDNEDCAGDAYSFAGKTMPAKNLILYAKWAPMSFTVTFDTVGGNAIDAQTVAAGDTANKPDNPTRAGYTFAGWTKNGSPFNFATAITENTTLVAQWVNGSKYTVAYDPNGGTGSKITDSNAYDLNTSAKLIAQPGEWKAPQTGYGLTYWSTNANGTGTKYYPGDLLKITESLVGSGAGITLYAQWAPIRQTTLTYDLNYAGAQAIDPVMIETPNEQYRIAQADPTRENGYTFLGWTIDKAGEGAKMKQGDIIQVDTLEPESNILYAQWSPNLTVTKVVEGNMGDSTKDFTFTIASEDTSLTGEYGGLKFTGGTATFTLKNGESKVVVGLPTGFAYTVTETGATEGYTTTVSVNGGATQNAATAQFDPHEPTTMVFTNTREVLVPTGFSRDGTPFMIMTVLALCAGAWLIYLKLRNDKGQHHA